MHFEFDNDWPDLWPQNKMHWREFDKMKTEILQCYFARHPNSKEWQREQRLRLMWYRQLMMQ